MGKEFLVGVANIAGYDITTGDLLFTSKTMLDDAIAISTGSTEIRGGQGDSLQYIYYHTSKMDVNMKDTQFNLAMIASTIGSSIGTGTNVYFEENITLGAGGTGVVTKTPLKTPDASAIYGWVTDATGTTTKVSFTGSNFTLPGGTTGQVVTVRYYLNNTAARTINVNANIIPSVIRLVMDAQLASDTAGTGMLGTIQVEIPRLQLDGGASLSLTSSGVSNTELKGMALSYVDSSAGGAGVNVYAKITRIVTSSNWYDTVYALAAVNDTVTVNTGSPTSTIDLRAIPLIGSAFKPPYSDITFASSDASKATVSAAGLITKVAVGSAIITCTITGKNSITTQVAVTVA